jgi:hypothetical protein
MQCALHCTALQAQTRPLLGCGGFSRGRRLATLVQGVGRRRPRGRTRRRDSRGRRRHLRRPLASSSTLKLALLSRTLSGRGLGGSLTGDGIENVLRKPCAASTNRSTNRSSSRRRRAYRHMFISIATTNATAVRGGHSGHCCLEGGGARAVPRGNPDPPFIHRSGHHVAPCYRQNDVVWIVHLIVAGALPRIVYSQ